MENSVAPDNFPIVKAYFEEARDLNDESRRESLLDRGYFDSKQLTPEELQTLAERKQPNGVFNRIKPAVRGLVGLWQQTSTAPRAYPRAPGDEDAADVASKTLRYVKDYADWPSKRMAAALNYFVEGTCATVVQVDDDSRVDVELISFEEFFHDPRSRALDFSDARFLGIAKWMFVDHVAEMYPDQKDKLESSLGGSLGGNDFTFEDRPRDIGSWVDTKRRRVFIVEMYHKAGKSWSLTKFWGGGILETGPSPYLNEKRIPCCPIMARSCYIDQDNRRYGEVRDMRAPQDEINKRRSKLLHILNSRQVVANDPAAMETDAELVRKEASRPDGVLPFGWGLSSMLDTASGQFALLADSQAEIERLGVNPAVLAQQSASASGRAQMVRQQAGMTDTAMTMAGLRLFELAVYRAIWARCKQFWTAPEFIRVTEDENSIEFVGINQPQLGPPQVMMGENNMPTIVRPVLGYENQIAEMDVDIIIDSVPDTVNLQAEQFAEIVELARVYGPQEVPFDDVLELSSMPEKRKIMEKREARKAEAGQSQQQAQQMQAQAAQLFEAEKMAGIEETRSKAALNAAKVQDMTLQGMVTTAKAATGMV